MWKIPIRIHAVADYLIGIGILVSPFVMPYPDNPMRVLAFAFGGALLGYSSMTDYPLAMLRFVPFPIHRGLDLLAGAGLLFSPIHFAVHGAPAVLFMATGAALLVLAFLTRGRFSPTGQDNPVLPGAG